ncbi:MAG: hypothetical protein ACLU5I_10900 [Alistipes finegoldii]
MEKKRRTKSPNWRVRPMKLLTSGFQPTNDSTLEPRRRRGHHTASCGRSRLCSTDLLTEGVDLT